MKLSDAVDKYIGEFIKKHAQWFPDGTSRIEAYQAGVRHGISELIDCIENNLDKDVVDSLRELLDNKPKEKEFKVGDAVWFMHDNKPKSGVIKGSCVSYSALSGRHVIEYTIVVNPSFFMDIVSIWGSSNLYSSKEELIKGVFGEANCK